MIYPFCVWFYVRGSGVRTMSKVILGLSVASLISFVVLYRVDQPAAYFLMPTRFWELGAGAIYFLRKLRPLQSPNREDPDRDRAGVDPARAVRAL